MRAARIVVVAVVVAACVVVTVAAVALLTRDHDNDVPLANPSLVVEGRSQTCTQLFGRTCDFATQQAFNMWGGELDAFVPTVHLDASLQPMSYQQVALLGLQTCNLLNSFDNNESAFLAMVSAQYPGHPPTLFFPVWSQSRSTLCPATLMRQ